MPSVSLLDQPAAVSELRSMCTRYLDKAPFSTGPEAT